MAWNTGLHKYQIVIHNSPFVKSSHWVDEVVLVCFMCLCVYVCLYEV